MAMREHRRATKYIEIYGPNADIKWVSSVQAAQAAIVRACQGDDPTEVEAATKRLKNIYDKALPFWRISIVREYVEAIVIALVLAMIIRTFVIQAFKIPSGSMIPTLLVGDHIIVNKFVYGFEVPFVHHKVMPLWKPKRGDIIVFRYPKNRDIDFIKRVVGVPGDVIELRDRRLFVNGEEIPRVQDGTYTYEDITGVKSTADLYRESLFGVKHPILLDRTFYMIDDRRITVPPDKYFMMGDNRDKSSDSRVWGFVDFNDIRGKALIIYFSWGPRQLLRIGKVVR